MNLPRIVAHAHSLVSSPSCSHHHNLPVYWTACLPWMTHLQPPPDGCECHLRHDVLREPHHDHPPWPCQTPFPTGPTPNTRAPPRTIQPAAGQSTDHVQRVGCAANHDCLPSPAHRCILDFPPPLGTTSVWMAMAPARALEPPGPIRCPVDATTRYSQHHTSSLYALCTYILYIVSHTPASLFHRSGG